jgi:hypothetical protein
MAQEMFAQSESMQNIVGVFRVASEPIAPIAPHSPPRRPSPPGDPSGYARSGPARRDRATAGS